MTLIDEALELIEYMSQSRLDKYKASIQRAAGKAIVAGAHGDKEETGKQMAKSLDRRDRVFNREQIVKRLKRKKKLKTQPAK